MGVHGESDEVLLAARDAASFERFYAGMSTSCSASSSAAPATPRPRPT